MNADADKKAKEEVEKLNEADTMVFQTEKQLKEYGDKIPAEKKAVIENALTELKAAHASKEISKIDSALAAINAAWTAASEDMYKANQEKPNQEDAAQNNAEQKPNSANTDNVTDVDFEEVK